MINCPEVIALRARKRAIMKVKQLLEDKNLGGHFGFESGKNASAAAKALKTAGIKFTRDDHGGIYNFNFTTKKEASAALKVVKPAIDIHAEWEWGAPDIQTEVRKIAKFLTSARHSCVAEIQVDDDCVVLTISVDFPEHFRTLAEVRDQIKKGGPFEKVSSEKSDRGDPTIRIYSFTLKRSLGNSSDKVHEELQSLVHQDFK
jgi:hypothetical protein